LKYIKYKHLTIKRACQILLQVYLIDSDMSEAGAPTAVAFMDLTFVVAVPAMGLSGCASHGLSAAATCEHRRNAYFLLKKRCFAWML
jgi:hypothetical protein